MADMIDCSNNGIPLDALLRDLFGQNAAHIHYLKIIVVAANTDSPIDCFTYEDFVSLLRQAIDLTGGVVALRVMSTNNSGATGITSLPPCGQHDDWWRIFAKSFYLDANDQVALNLLNTT